MSAWTAMNGEYVGILREVKGSPWRAVVEITGVIKPAVVFEIGRSVQRRGFRPGEQIEVGGSSCRPTTEIGTSYADALRAQLSQFQEWQGSPARNPKDTWLDQAVEDVKKAIKTEDDQNALSNT